MFEPRQRAHSASRLGGSAGTLKTDVDLEANHQPFDINFKGGHGVYNYDFERNLQPRQGSR